MLTPIDNPAEMSNDDFMTTRRYKVEATLPNRIEVQRGLEVHVVTYQASTLTGVWFPSAFTMPSMELSARDILVIDPAGEVVFSAVRARTEVALEEIEPGVWSGPSAFELSDMVMGQPGEGTLSIGRLMAATTIEGMKLEPYGQMANQLQTDPEGIFGLLLDPESSDQVMSKMIDLVASSRFKMSIQNATFVDDTDVRKFALAELTIGAEAHQMSANDMSLAISFGLSGLDVPSDAAEAALIPSAAEFALAVNGIPVETLGRQLLEMLGNAFVEAAQAGLESATPASQLSAGMAEVSTRMLSALNDAGTEANIDIAIESEASNVELSGQVTAQHNALFGAVGSFDLTVGDLAALIAMTDYDPQLAAYKDLIEAFAATAVTDTESSGTDPASFAIVIDPASSIMVNGEDAMTIISNALIAPQGPADQMQQ